MDSTGIQLVAAEILDNDHDDIGGVDMADILLIILLLILLIYLA